MRRFLFPIVSLATLFCCLSFVNWAKNREIRPDDRVSVLISEWSGEKPTHLRTEINPSLAKMGQELVYKGWTTKDGKKTKLISKYFECIDCHNQVQEDPDLTKSSPELRLEKAVQDGIPFLQGTTFYGQVNRKHWYNMDYYKKYGNLVKPANDTLENAIQLCAKVCSSGRYLEQWEEEAIVQYFNTIDYKIADLNLSTIELNYLNDEQTDNSSKLVFLKTKYLDYSPATFIDVPKPKDRKLGANGVKENGQLIFKQSCISCHSEGNDATHLKLSMNELSKRYFRGSIKRDIHVSLYNIVRDGTKSDFAIREYMPHYTAERMSEQQLEDLVSYIMSKE